MLELSVAARTVPTGSDILTGRGQGKRWDPSRPGGHSYATGGSNAAEHWFAAATLGDSLLADSPIRVRGPKRSILGARVRRH